MSLRHCEYIPVFGKKWVIPLRQLSSGRWGHKTYHSPPAPLGLRRLRGQETETSLNWVSVWQSPPPVHKQPHSYQMKIALQNFSPVQWQCPWVWGFNLSHNKCNQSVCRRPGRLEAEGDANLFSISCIIYYFVRALGSSTLCVSVLVTQGIISAQTFCPNNDDNSVFGTLRADKKY